MIEVLTVNGNNITISSFTPQEKEQRAIRQELAEQQKLLDSLIPTHEEIQKAEMELLMLELLMELEVI